MRSEGELAMTDSLKRLSRASLVSLLVLLFACTNVQAQTCPKDAQKIKSMIGELRDTFECSGLSFKTCREYSGRVIAGAAAGVTVGGPLAARTAAGLALMKSKGIVCPMP